MANQRQRALGAFVAGKKPDMPKGVDQIGFYNATHVHGKPARNLIADLKRQRLQGSDTRGGQGIHDPSLDMGGQTVNRAQAARNALTQGYGTPAQGVHMYPAPGAAQQIAQTVATGTPTKPPVDPGHTRYPMDPVAGGDAVTYPLRRPKRRVVTSYTGA